MINKQKIEKSISDEFYNSGPGSSLKKNYFNYNSILAFYADNGKIISQTKLRKNVMCAGGTGKAGVMLYSNDRDKISFMNINGDIIWDHETYTYPFMRLNNDLVLLITGENAGYAALNTKSKVLSEPISSGILLTSFDISSETNLIIMGYANGNIKLFSRGLKELWYKKFLNSNIQIVKKVIASSRGRYFAALTGLEPEYLNIIDVHGRLNLNSQAMRNSCLKKAIRDSGCTLLKEKRLCLIKSSSLCGINAR